MNKGKWEGPTSPLTNGEMAVKNPDTKTENEQESLRPSRRERLKETPENKDGTNPYKRLRELSQKGGAVKGKQRRHQSQENREQGWDGSRSENNAKTTNRKEDEVVADGEELPLEGGGSLDGNQEHCPLIGSTSKMRGTRRRHLGGRSDGGVYGSPWDASFRLRLWVGGVRNLNDSQGMAGREV